jgi:hypothetical protein
MQPAGRRSLHRIIKNCNLHIYLFLDTASCLLRFWQIKTAKTYCMTVLLHGASQDNNIRTRNRLHTCVRLLWTDILRKTCFVPVTLIYVRSLSLPPVVFPASKSKQNHRIMLEFMSLEQAICWSLKLMLTELGRCVWSDVHDLVWAVFSWPDLGWPKAA